MNKTKIEYLDYTWNPICMKCTPVSEGCLTCWHLAMAKRLTKNPMISKGEREAYAGGPPVLRKQELETPLHLRKPSRIGVQFMGDLFSGLVPYEFQCDIFDVILSQRRHQFFILTKRPKAMRDFIEIVEDWPYGPTEWNHVWLGISVEDQKTANERIPILLQIPATHRWVSIEPMLGSINFTHPEQEGFYHNLLKGFSSEPPVPGIDWVVCGGLSLPGGKIQPPKEEWVDHLVKQCRTAGVPLFLKTNAQYPEIIQEYPNGSI